MTQPTYPAARAAAVRIHAHLARHAAAHPSGRNPAAVPDTEAIEALIEAPFGQACAAKKVTCRASRSHSFHRKACDGP